MNIIVKNVNLSLCIPLTGLQLTGFWPPKGLSERRRLIYNSYAVVSFIFLLGTYLFIQVVDLFIIWGNLPLMSQTAFLLLTNIAEATKIASLVVYRRTVSGLIDEANLLLGSEEGQGKEYVKSCNRETSRHYLLYLGLTMFTIAGWALSAEKNHLPLRAWYPYDTSKSPAFELTYVHQVVALFIAGFLNVSMDALISTLIAQCCVRLRLVGIGLQTLCEDLEPNEQGILNPEQEETVKSRLKVVAQRHQAALAAADQLQECFTAPIFVQFLVSMVIICVSAFELAASTGNLVRFFSLATYLYNMAFEVFLYCYHGNQLSDESEEIATHAYSCPWYALSTKLRRSLLVVMVRARRPAVLTAAGFTTLQLTSFMSIIKTSYSLFTVLQQSEEN